MKCQAASTNVDSAENPFQSVFYLEIPVDNTIKIVFANILGQGWPNCMESGWDSQWIAVMGSDQWPYYDFNLME